VMEELHFDAAYSVVVIQHLAPPDVQDLFGLVGSVLVGKGVFRFQYVNETAEWGPLSWPMAAGIVEQLLYNAGLDVVGTNEDPLRPTWTWCTAVKRAT
jgi:cyclopropane fatty-acyl-phospholipid synthase-like methyltransferase